MSEAHLYTNSLVSFEAYLLGEKAAEERHEFVDGQVIAMAGASESHEIVAGNMFVAIHQHLRGKGCRVFTGDMKLRIDLRRRELSYYPDIMVTCDPADAHALYKESPKVLIEVMSNYKTDHLEKLFVYQQIPSLEQYLVISQDADAHKAWLYQRATQWDQEDGAPDGVIELSALGFSMKLEDAYSR